MADGKPQKAPLFYLDLKAWMLPTIFLGRCALVLLNYQPAHTWRIWKFTSNSFVTDFELPFGDTVGKRAEKGMGTIPVRKQIKSWAWFWTELVRHINVCDFAYTVATVVHITIATCTNDHFDNWSFILANACEFPWLTPSSIHLCQPYLGRGISFISST